MDMIGRSEEFVNRRTGEVTENASDNVNTLHLIGSQKLSEAVHNVCLAMNQGHVGFEFEYDEEDVFYRSDHVKFVQKDIPVAFFSLVSILNITSQTTQWTGSTSRSLRGSRSWSTPSLSRSVTRRNGRSATVCGARLPVAAARRGRLPGDASSISAASAKFVYSWFSI